MRVSTRFVALACWVWSIYALYLATQTHMLWASDPMLDPLHAFVGGVLATAIFGTTAVGWPGGETA